MSTKGKKNTNEFSFDKEPVAMECHGKVGLKYFEILEYITVFLFCLLQQR